MKAILLQRDTAVARRVMRVWHGVGLEVEIVEDPSIVPSRLEEAAILGVDDFDQALLLSCLERYPTLRGVAWTTEPLTDLLEAYQESPRLLALMGRSGYDSAPRDWELRYVGTHVKTQGIIPSIAQVLGFGVSSTNWRIQTTAELERAVEAAVNLAQNLPVVPWIAENVGELAHELLMNALYAAPGDARGDRHASDRKASVALASEEFVSMDIATDGRLLAMSVSDPFGRLTRQKVFSGLARALRDKTVDVSGGGAGLGMAVCHHASNALVFDVRPSIRTQISAFIDLEMGRRDFRNVARSLHFYDYATHLG